MLTHLATNQAITNADLAIFIQPWQEALELEFRRKNSNRIRRSHTSAEL